MRSRRKRKHQKKKSMHRITRCCANKKTYCGYCHSSRHRGWITIQVMAEHNCLEKNCPLFEQCEHPLWMYKDYKTKQISHKRLNKIKSLIDYPVSVPTVMDDLVPGNKISTYVIDCEEEESDATLNDQFELI